MSISARVGGAWKDISEAAVRVSGSWKDIEQAYVRAGGVWQPLLDTAPPTLTFIGRTVDNSDIQNYTFSDVPIGDAAANRRVIVVIHSWTRDSDRTLTSASVDGGGAIHVTAHTAASFNLTSAIASAVVTSGTTATITVNHSAAMRGCAIDVYVAYGLANAGATATNSANATSNGTNISTTINVLDDGIIIAGGGIFISTNMTWPNLTEDAEGTYDAGSADATMGAASVVGADAQTGRTVTLNCGTGDRRVLAVAAFR